MKGWSQHAAPVAMGARLARVVSGLVVYLILTSCVVPARASSVTEVTTRSLHALAKEKPVLLELHASWCGHCKRFAAQYEQVAEALSPGVVVARSDGSIYRLLSQRFGLSGFPSFYFVANGKAWEYTSHRSVDGLVQFAESGGKIGGREMKGFFGPMGPYWEAVGKAVDVWERARVMLKSYDISPTIAIAIASVMFFVVLGSFGLVIHFITKPAVITQRPKQN